MPIRQARDLRRPLIAVVGLCASGKSSLVQALRARGYNAREVAQEHSLVPDMWQRLTGADVLVYLDVTFEVATQRGGLIEHDGAWWSEQHQRLRHAHQHAHVVIQTDTLTAREVEAQVLRFLQDQSIPPAAGVAGLAR